MRLSIRDIEELNRIKDGLEEIDYERINAEVEALTKSSCPVTAILRKFKPEENTEDAVSFLENYCSEYQTLSGESWWDIIHMRVTAEYVFEEFKRRHQEAA